MQSPIYPDVEMKQIVRNGITIDYCPKSGGVWLDKGELEKLIEYAKREERDFDKSNMPFSDEDDRDNYDDRRDSRDKKYRKRKRRENPISEIFDFDFF